MMINLTELKDSGRIDKPSVPGVCVSTDYYPWCWVDAIELSGVPNGMAKQKCQTFPLDSSLFGLLASKPCTECPLVALVCLASEYALDLVSTFLGLHFALSHVTAVFG